MTPTIYLTVAVIGGILLFFDYRRWDEQAKQDFDLSSTLMGIILWPVSLALLPLYFVMRWLFKKGGMI